MTRRETPRFLPRHLTNKFVTYDGLGQRMETVFPAPRLGSTHGAIDSHHRRRRGHAVTPRGLPHRAGVHSLCRTRRAPRAPDSRAYFAPGFDSARLQHAGHERQAVSRGEATRRAVAGYSRGRSVRLDSRMHRCPDGRYRSTLQARGSRAAPPTRDADHQHEWEEPLEIHGLGEYFD